MVDAGRALLLCKSSDDCFDIQHDRSEIQHDRRSQHNLDIFDFEAHNLPPVLHLLIWSERTLRALYSHSFRYGEFHTGTERIEYANFLSVDTLVTDHTRLPSAATEFSFSIQFSNAFTMVSPSSPAFEADSPFVLSPGASPPVRGVRYAAAKVKAAFPGSNSSKKARRKLELGSKPSIQDPDLPSTRAYKQELAEKLAA
jgi:hypothetical protein